MKHDSSRPELAPRTDNTVTREGESLSFHFHNPAAGRDDYRDMLVAVLAESGLTRSRLASRMGVTRAGINPCFTEGRNMSVTTMSNLLWHMGYVVTGITVRTKNDTDRLPESLAHAATHEGGGQ